MTDYIINTPTHGLPFLFVFLVIFHIVSTIREALETRHTRREKYAADSAEMRADLAEVKASAQTILEALVDLRTHFDAVAGKLDATADRMDAAVTRMDAPKLRIVPAAE
jgi:hypothetical protein